MKHITTNNGYEVLIDDEDYESISRWVWRAFENKGPQYTSYAHRMIQKDGRSQNIYMHREIANAPKGMDVDHVNGNGLDNRRCNLRVCTHRENLLNTRYHRALPAKIDAAIDYISKNFSQDLNPGRIAAHAGLNNERLATEIGRRFGCRIMDLVWNCRMQEASRLLAETNLEIDDIAVACGVHTFNYIYPQFKRRFGMTPQQYRYQCREMAAA